jgi:hypothetical protein
MARLLGWRVWKEYEEKLMRRLSVDSASHRFE